eukprot:313224_1
MGCCCGQNAEQEHEAGSVVGVSEHDEVDQNVWKSFQLAGIRTLYLAIGVVGLLVSVAIMVMVYRHIYPSVKLLDGSKKTLGVVADESTDFQQVELLDESKNTLGVVADELADFQELDRQVKDLLSKLDIVEDKADYKTLDEQLNTMYTNVLDAEYAGKLTPGDAMVMSNNLLNARNIAKAGFAELLDQ